MTPTTVYINLNFHVSLILQITLNLCFNFSLAHDLADRLLPAFEQTETGTECFRYSVQNHETWCVTYGFLLTKTSTRDTQDVVSRAQVRLIRSLAYICVVVVVYHITIMAIGHGLLLFRMSC